MVKSSTNGAMTTLTESDGMQYTPKSLASNIDPVKLLSEKDKKTFTGWVRGEYEKMKANRTRIRRQWDVNLEMYGGHQYVEQMFKAGSNLSSLGTKGNPKNRERAMINRIEPMIRTEITRQTSQKPSVTVVPASGEDDDLFAAQAAEAVWEFMYVHYKIPFIMERNAFWTSVTGNGFIKTWWDASKKDNLFKNVLGAPTVGNIRYGIVTPYNMFVPDLLCEEIEDQPYLLEAYTRPVEWANAFFGGEYKANLVAKTEIFESNYFQQSGDGDAIPDSVLIIEAYIKPGGTKHFPNGGVVTLCGDTLVRFVEGMPYSHDEYPYAHTKHIMTGKFYAKSVLESINPLQRDYNKLRSQINESIYRMGRPQLLAPIGTMDMSKYTSEPGLIIPYKPALGKPEPLQIQPLPSHIPQQVDRVIQDMEDISGQHQASRGMSPGSGVVAATAIAFLQEKDDAIISTTISSIEQTVAKISRHGLTLAVDYWDTPRLIRVTGADRSFDSFVLKGSDIANGLDIRVEPGSALPMSKAAKQAMLMDFYTSGAITKEQLLDQLPIGGVEQLIERMRMDMRVAQRENLRMKRLTEQDINDFMVQTMESAVAGNEGTIDPQTGTPTVDPGNLMTYPPIVPVQKWHNHQVHITTHNNFRNTQGFESLPPIVQDQFDRHIAIHESYVAMQLMNPVMGQAQAGMPNDQLGMVPELNTGPDGTDPNSMQPGQQSQQQPM